MIDFYAGCTEEYNYIVHNFLDVALDGDDERPQEVLEICLPEYLLREQKERCLKALRELLEWTADEEIHEMSALHQLILYEFLEYLASTQDDLPDFREIYFDSRSDEMIRKLAEEEYAEYGEEDMTPEDYQESYYNITFYEDILFEDTDFLFVLTMAEQGRLRSSELERVLGLDMENYIDLFPIKLQKQYREMKRK